MPNRGRPLPRLHDLQFRSQLAVTQIVSLPDLKLPELPIRQALPDLLRALRSGTAAVLVAPPGAGKTTVVPLALADEPWVRGRRIVMLEPRRLAARAAARRMAALQGEQPGQTVGYRMRLETRVSAATRIEVVTEGVLTRILQSDAALEEYAAVIFDEFHERSLNADLGLALVQQSRQLLREDLRVVVMSATLDVEPVAALLSRPEKPVPVVSSEGRTHPVQVRWRPLRSGQRVESATAAAVREALDATDGDVLVFLPGAAEIRRTESILAESISTDAAQQVVHILPLHGSLPVEMQDAALTPSRVGERKVVLATSIAESSLTIDGVRAVVDAGLARIPRFDPRSGMTRLTTVRVSKAGAEQRKGRAGRQAPGVCIRLWAEHEHAALQPHPLPEIMEADLAPLALELAAAGVRHPGELAWLDLPPAGALSQARELLHELNALDDDGRVTPHGRRMAELPVHPRIAHMLLASREAGTGALATACDVAALLGERDVLRGEDGPPDADLRLRLALVSGGGGRGSAGANVDRGALERVRCQSKDLRRRMGVPSHARANDADAGRVLALAYPDRVARRRRSMKDGDGAGGGQRRGESSMDGKGWRYLMRSGVGAVLSSHSSLSREEWLAVAETDGRRPEARIYLAAPLNEADVIELFGDQVVHEEETGWDDRTDAVVSLRREQLGAIVLREVPVRDVSDERIAEALLAHLRTHGMESLPWTPASRRVRERMAFAAWLEPDDWPDVSDSALLDSLDEWLLPFLGGIRRRAELERVDLSQALLSRLTWKQRETLDELAPTHITLPSGRREPVDYSDPAAPVLAVRIQELFGVKETPAVGRGRVPLVLHLLSPARRPVQVTRDLAGFWRTSYRDVRKEMKGRYPKHDWPEDGGEAKGRAK